MYVRILITIILIKFKLNKWAGAFEEYSVVRLIGMCPSGNQTFSTFENVQVLTVKCITFLIQLFPHPSGKYPVILIHVILAICFPL